MKKTHCLLPQTLLDALQLCLELELQHAISHARTPCHPGSGPLPPHRNRAPGEMVGGVEGTRDNWSRCPMTDICCVFMACFAGRGGRGSVEHSSPSPSWGDQPPSNWEMLLSSRFPSLVPGIFWHVSGLSEVFLKPFLFYCQNPSVSQCVSPQRGVKWRHDGFAHPTFSEKGRNVEQTLPEHKSFNFKGFPTPSITPLKSAKRCCVQPTAETRGGRVVLWEQLWKELGRGTYAGMSRRYC